MHDLSRDLLLREKKDDSMELGAAGDDSVGRGDERTGENGIHRHAHTSAVIVQLKAKGTGKKRREREIDEQRKEVICFLLCNVFGFGKGEDET
jgi:hypothetical protein